MNEFLSEKEQIELFRQWWRENGWYLVGGIGLGVLGLLGWNRYNAYVDVRAEEAAAIYVELRQAVGDDDAGGARNLLNELREDFAGSPYTDQGGLLVALMRLDDGQVDGAIGDLRYVIENTGDQDLSLVARLRLARVLAQDESYAEALAALDVAPGSFAAGYEEVRGDIHVALGDIESARVAYSAALNDLETGLVNRDIVQMKLDDLSAPAAQVSPVAGTAPGGEAVTPDGDTGATPQGEFATMPDDETAAAESLP